MIAVHLDNGRVTVRKAPKPRRPQGHALIRLLCGGICNTDLELKRGYQGFTGVPGHEFVGEVVEADTKRLVGHRVVGEINLSCGKCSWCQRAMGRHCPSRKVLGIAKQAGAFREFFTLPERNLRRVPDLVPTEAAVFAEPLAAACEILEQARIPELDEIAVLGDGKLGLLIGQVLTVHGYEVHLFGKDPAKLRLAVKLGLMAEMAPRKLPRAAYNWVVEATGAPDGLRHALEMVRPRGTVILKSTLHRPVLFNTASCVVNEITLLGSRCGRIEPALELLRTEKVDVLDMISDRFPLSRAPRAFERAAEKGVLKVLLT